MKFFMVIIPLLLIGCATPRESQSDYEKRVKTWSADIERRVIDLEMKVNKLQTK